MKTVVKSTLPCMLGTLLLIVPLVADARAPVSRQTSKDFRELIVRGERPEIAACMVAALGSVRTNAKFDAIRWSNDDSDLAHMVESENGGHLLRNVKFSAQLRLRVQGFFSDPWLHGKITCEQRDEEFPKVLIIPVSSQE